MVPEPMILPFWLPPNPTTAPGLSSSSWNICFSPVMCREHPLSRYHDWCLNGAVKDISFSSSESDSVSDAISASGTLLVLAINAVAPCSSSESPSSDSESSQVAISHFLPFWNLLGFPSFLSFGHSLLYCPVSLHSKQITSLSAACKNKNGSAGISLSFDDNKDFN